MWYALFLKRHREIAERMSQALTKSRGDVTEAQIQSWFAEISKHMLENNLEGTFADPRHVFNTDETAFFCALRAKKCLSGKGR